MKYPVTVNDVDFVVTTRRELNDSEQVQLQDAVNSVGSLAALQFGNLERFSILEWEESSAPVEVVPAAPAAPVTPVVDTVDPVV